VVPMLCASAGPAISAAATVNVVQRTRNCMAHLQIEAAPIDRTRRASEDARRRDARSTSGGFDDRSMVPAARADRIDPRDRGARRSEDRCYGETSAARRARTAVGVLDPDDVIQVVRGHLEHLTLLESHHTVPTTGGDVVSLTRSDLELAQHSLLVLEDQQHAARIEEEGLVLPLVVLQGQLVAGVDVEDLGGVAVRTGQRSS
jgi:hypothetical protein